MKDTYFMMVPKKYHKFEKMNPSRRRAIPGKRYPALIVRNTGISGYHDNPLFVLVKREELGGRREECCSLRDASLHPGFAACISQLFSSHSSLSSTPNSSLLTPHSSHFQLPTKSRFRVAK
jgi:hypothetical protein